MFYQGIEMPHEGIIAELKRLGCSINRGVVGVGNPWHPDGIDYIDVETPEGVAIDVEEGDERNLARLRGILGGRQEWRVIPSSTLDEYGGRPTLAPVPTSPRLRGLEWWHGLPHSDVLVAEYAGGTLFADPPQPKSKCWVFHWQRR